MSTSKDYEVVVSEMRALVEKQVAPCYKWYDGSKKWPRIFFRSAGLIVVIGSLLLPVIASRKGMPYRDDILTSISLAVAVMTSLNAFFRWDAAWRSRTRAAYALQGLLGRWEFRLKAAEESENPKAAALAATEKLFDEAFTLVGSETDEFFANVRWPEAPRPSGA
jgi:hypothetical protein